MNLERSLELLELDELVAAEVMGEPRPPDEFDHKIIRQLAFASAPEPPKSAGGNWIATMRPLSPDKHHLTTGPIEHYFEACWVPAPFSTNRELAQSAIDKFSCEASADLVPDFFLTLQYATPDSYSHSSFGSGPPWTAYFWTNVAGRGDTPEEAMCRLLEALVEKRGR